MTVTLDHLRLLHGAEDPLASMQTLRAGPVTLQLDGIDLRYLRVGPTELVRRIYPAVRDVDWDTVAPTISGLTVEEGERSFRVEFDARHARTGIDFSWHGLISGDESGRIEYLFDGRANALCPYNRIGVCVHHPWRETAGAAYRAHTPAGEITGTYPDLIGQQAIVDGAYQALFPAFDRIEIELDGGGTLRLEFEGDLWETEDHRNWTDANFKTYSTPISRGRPAPLQPEQTLLQRVVMTPVDVPEAEVQPGPVRLLIAGGTGFRVPAIGLGADRDRQRPHGPERDALRLVSPRHIRVDLRLDGDDWPDALAAAQDTARAADAGLELALMLRDEYAPSLGEVALALTGGPRVERVLVTVAGARTATPEETTPGRLVDVARAALAEVAPDAQFAGGTEMYFTEINRTRPDLSTWDGLCYSISPQIHAFTDLDVVENLDAQAETIRSARAIAGAKSVIVSPITIRRRVNFHAASEPPPPSPGQLPDSVDVRQSSLLGAAWTTASLKYVSEAGASSVTYYESTGWRGVVERTSGSELPDRFRSTAGDAFPLLHPLADVCAWHGAEVLSCTSTDVLAAVALAVRWGDGTLRLLVANLKPVEQDVVIGPLDGELRLRRLNEVTAAEASAEPVAFREGGEVTQATGELSLTLDPYEVVLVAPG